MTDQYYMLRLDDPAVPAFCSFAKMYVDTLDDIQFVMHRLALTKKYPDTVMAWDSYCSGNTNATHNVAYHEEPLLTPVEFVSSSLLSLPERIWNHFNAWECPYKMKISGGVVRQIVVKYKDKYIRMIRAWLDNLCFESLDNEWSPLTDGFWGHGSLLYVIQDSEEQFTLHNLLFVVEDSADTYAELEAKLTNPEEVILAYKSGRSYTRSNLR